MPIDHPTAAERDAAEDAAARARLLADGFRLGGRVVKRGRPRAKVLTVIVPACPYCNARSLDLFHRRRRSRVLHGQRESYVSCRACGNTVHMFESI